MSPGAEDYGAAEDINFFGRIVGTSFLPDDQQDAMVWDPWHRTGRDLGVLPGGSFASLVDVDDLGRAAGGGDSGGNLGVTKAVVWPGYGPLLALNPLSGDFQDDFAVARKLGAQGEAVGASLDAAGDIHGTVWTCAFRQAFLPAAQGQPSNDLAPSARTTTAKSRQSEQGQRRWTEPALSR